MTLILVEGFLTRSERRLLWQSRIQAFHTGGEKSDASWCAKQEWLWHHRNVSLGT